MSTSINPIGKPFSITNALSFYSWTLRPGGLRVNLTCFQCVYNGRCIFAIIIVS
jgi:hypothetical protein